MKPIEDRLRETIGLDAASVGPGLIQRAVRQRMRSLGLKRLEDYQRSLEHSRAEWNELVESVVVTETWFFRDPEPIAAFVRLVREEWLPAHATAPLRLLSVPCSSGEEPFSLVMALLDAGVPADRFQVEAVDISARALARAARGVYGRNSFRGKDLAFRDRYFQPSAEGFRAGPGRSQLRPVLPGQLPQRRLPAQPGRLRFHLLPQSSDLPRPADAPEGPGQDSNACWRPPASCLSAR